MLLDTDVLVDILRGHPPAVAWLTGSGAVSIGLPGLVAMELLQGCRSLADQQRLEKQLRRFTLHWPTQADCQRAYQDFAAYRLSHNLGLLDSLIGQTAVGLGQVLATFNVKHYSVIAGLTTTQLY
jgi:predicted nucleic acid-binding protein